MGPYLGSSFGVLGSAFGQAHYSALSGDYRQHRHGAQQQLEFARQMQNVAAAQGMQNVSINYNSGLCLAGWRQSGLMAYDAEPYKGPAYDRHKQAARRTVWRRAWRTAAVLSVRLSRSVSVFNEMTLSEARFFNCAALAMLAAWVFAFTLQSAFR